MKENIKLKKFMLYNILCSIIILLCLYCISKKFEQNFEVEKKKFYIYNELPENTVEIVALGNSHTRLGILFQDKKNINLANNSQNFYYDLQLLKKYNRKIKKNATIIIPISIQSFYSANNKQIDINYVDLLSKSEIKNIGLVKYILKRNFRAFFPPSNLFKIFEINNKNEIYYYPNDLNDKLRETESIETVKIHLGIEKNELRDYSKLNGEEDFINLVEYIEKNEWKLLLITTPFSKIYNDNIENYNSEAFKERIYDNIFNNQSNVKEKFYYIDYSHDKRFEEYYKYFLDDDHLNRSGAEYFTNILLEDIKNNF